MNPEELEASKIRIRNIMFEGEEKINEIEALHLETQCTIDILRQAYDLARDMDVGYDKLCSIAQDIKMIETHKLKFEDSLMVMRKAQELIVKSVEVLEQLSP